MPTHKINFALNFSELGLLPHLSLSEFHPFLGVGSQCESLKIGEYIGNTGTHFGDKSLDCRMYVV